MNLKRNRLTVLMAFLLLTIVVFVGFVFSKNYINDIEPSEGLTKRDILQLQNLKIPRPINTDNKIAFAVREQQFNLPTKAPIIELEQVKTISKDEAIQIARHFGFESEPVVAEDIRIGTIYIWSDRDKAVSVRANSGSILYTLQDTPREVQNKRLSPDTIEKIASEFLKDFPSSGVGSSEFSFISFYDITNTTQGLHPTSKDNADIYQVNFGPQLTINTKLVTFNPDASPIYVWVLPDGTISKSEIRLILPSENPAGEVKLKDYNETANSINDSVLVSINDGNQTLSELDQTQIREITIDKIELAYLLGDIESKYTTPIYILSGITSIRGFTEPVTATLYLPAISSNQP